MLRILATLVALNVTVVLALALTLKTVAHLPDARPDTDNHLVRMAVRTTSVLVIFSIKDNQVCDEVLTPTVNYGS